MEKPLIRKSSRTLNLMKPAPRKGIPNGLIKDAVKSEEAEAVKTEVVIVEKENKLLGKRATRGLKLEKPAPLKSSKIINDGTTVSGISVPEATAMHVNSPERGETSVDTVQPHKSAEMKANILIKEALADMEVFHNNSKPHRENRRQTKLLSQVSEDSGIGDMSWYSRQGSMLQSLSENQDDLDWDDIDDSADTTFSLSSKHLACLPSMVNQVQPYNSLLANDNILSKNINADVNGNYKLKIGRNNSYQNKSSINRNQNISRSFSVPANLSNSNNNNSDISVETEFWDEEADFFGNALEMSAHCYTKTARTERARNLSLQNNKARVDDSVRKRHASYAGNCVNRRDAYNTCDITDTVILDRDTNHSSGDFSTKNSEDWETDVTDLDVIQLRQSIPVDTKNSSKNDTYSAISGECIDPDATPRADMHLKFLNDPATSSIEKGLYITEESGNIHSDQNCDEQRYAWELIEDLSVKVDSLKLDSQNGDMECFDVLDNMGLKGIMMPLDIDEIEAELEFMTNREDLELSESLSSEKSKYIHSVFKTRKSGIGGKVVITREPLHPYSSQEEVWYAEEGMPTGHSTAKGRRGMFRYYRNCQIDEREAETTMNLLQYSPEELLELGTSESSNQKPVSWSYLEQIYPDICLKQVSGFDAERYALERDYVVAVQNVTSKKGNFETRFNCGSSVFGQMQQSVIWK